EVWSERCSDAAIRAPARVTEISAADRVAEISLISVIRLLVALSFEPPYV
ncbi:hypothetical protein PtrEW4_011242, partial [Pyrenophora tritici-repentis]